MQKKTQKQYSARFKAEVVKETLKEEKTFGQLAAEYGVHSPPHTRHSFAPLLRVKK
jgi:transposase-like protein